MVHSIFRRMRIYHLSLEVCIFFLIIPATTIGAGGKEEKKEHFFYDKSGILTIDGSVKGQSEPITLDMKAPKFICALKQYFMFTFCPDFKLLHKENRRCEEGIIFCYEPILTPQFVREQYVVETIPELEVSKKCGENFRGFKVSLKRMRNTRYNYRLFYEIQTSFKKEPYYFVVPESSLCINLWLGNEFDLETSVRTIDNVELEPEQVRTSFGNSTLLGVSNETYYQDFPDIENLKRYGESPGLNMLYLDFKSREYTPQFMFTVGPETRCNLYARVRSNKVGACKTGFKQKTVSLRAYGQNATTSYTLTIETGVETNETRGSKSIMEKILSKEFEEGTEEENADTVTDEGIQSYSEDVAETETENLENRDTGPVTEEKDVTPAWKKQKAAAINTAAAAACGALDFFTAGLASCSANVEYKDTQTTTFQESFTKDRIKNSKSTSATNSVHSVQTVMQTAFTHSRGKSDTTRKSEEHSMSNIVSDKKIFVFEVEVPKGKVMTPMQMMVNCDGSHVMIPWLKFKIQSESDAFSDEYGEDDDGGNTPVKEEIGAEEDYSLVKPLRQQEQDSAVAFEPPPRDFDYTDYLGIGEEKGGGETTGEDAGMDYGKFVKGEK